MIGASLLQPEPAAGRALGGLVPALLGAAAFTVVPVGDTVYVAATTGLVLLGAAAASGAALIALRGPAIDRAQSIAGSTCILAGAAALAVRAASLVGSVGLLRVVAWGAGVAVAWWLLLLAGRLLRLPSALAWLDRAVLARRPPATLTGIPRVPRAALGILGFGACLVLFAPHAGLAIGGLVMAALGAELTFRGARRGVPVLPLVTLTLLPAWWLLHTVAGPVGLRIATLDQVPLSPAAARTVALPFGLVAWAWTGLWPLHGVVRPVLLAPLGAALWFRVAEPVAAEGLAHWQPLFVTLTAAGLWHASANGRLAAVFVALAFVALASLAPPSAPAAGLLLGAALALELPQPLARRLGFAASAAGAGLAFAAGLQAEVVLTVLAAAGLAYGYRAASPASAP
ncbi:MAG: hypothetical protein ACREOF_05070 [Gemmatimonadales bacterium]